MLNTSRRFVTNLNCARCIAAVKPHLDAVPGLMRWQVDTSTPDKILTVEGPTVLSPTIETAVANAGFRVIRELVPPAEHKPAHAEPEPSAKTSYYPLLLLGLFLVLVVALVEIRAGMLDWSRAMKTFMGAFFLTFAFFKLLDLRGFADSYRMYDVVAKYVPTYGFLYPFVELGLGVAYVLGWWPWTTSVLTMLVMSVSIIGVIQSLLQKRKIRCACLGTVFNLPMSTVTLVEDGLMIAMAAMELVLLCH